MTTRVKWTDETIVARIRELLPDATVMPTAGQLRAIGENAVVCAIVKRGGFDKFAELCGLEKSSHDSRFGWKWEAKFAEEARSMGMDVQERARVKEHFDLVVNDHTIDVKVASAGYIANGNQWTWRINKKAHSCEFYGLIAVDEHGNHDTHVVPASDVPLTCATMRTGGKYAKWKDAWWQLAKKFVAMDAAA